MFRIFSFLINHVWTKLYVTFRTDLMRILLATQPP